MRTEGTDTRVVASSAGGTTHRSRGPGRDQGRLCHLVLSVALLSLVHPAAVNAAAHGDRQAGAVAVEAVTSGEECAGGR